MNKEQYIIGCMMLQPDAYEYCRKHLRYNDFADQTAQKVFRAAMRFDFEGRAFDKTNLSIEFDGDEATMRFIEQTVSACEENPYDWKRYADETVSKRNIKDRGQRLTRFGTMRNWMHEASMTQCGKCLRLKTRRSSPQEKG